MPDFSPSPVTAMKAGNRVELALSKSIDPIYLAKVRWNHDLVLAGNRPTGSEAPRDGAAYTVPGAPQPFCWPHVKVSWRTGFQPGPEIRFQQRDDGMHLTVVLEEDPPQRVPGTLPFDIKVKPIRLIYGSGPADSLEFPEPLPEPQDPTKGPAFTIEADALVPLDERRARLVAALQTRDAAKWVVAMEFEWVQTTTHPPRPGPGVPSGGRFGRLALPRHGPVVVRHDLTRSATFTSEQPIVAKTIRTAGLTTRPEIWRAILVSQPVGPRTTTEVRTLGFTRTLNAEYPKDSPENRPIFAAVTGDYVQVGWKNTAHGWFQPTPIQDTVYCLPSSYRLQVNEATGLPSIQAILTRKGGASETIDPLDSKNYIVRLSIKVQPHFEAEQLNALRGLIRAESNNTVPFADLVLGGYSGARFIPDPALSGLGELFAGSTAETRDTINPETGFTLTYEGNAEFIDLLFQRLKGEGIEGTVELDLQEPGGSVRKQPVPVILTLRKLASISLPWSFVAPIPPADTPETETDPSDLLPRDIELHNPTGVEVTLAQLQAHALQKSPVTGHVEDWYRAEADGTWPRKLAPGESASIRLALNAERPIYNAWDVSLVDCHTSTSAELVLSQIFDVATSGVRGWQIAIDCPPMAFFDQLTPEDQAKVRDIVAMEVEVRRKDSSLIEEVRLTRQATTGSVLLSRTVADFVSDRSTGRSVFEFRQRALRPTRADDWSPWREESGSALSIFLT